MMKGRRSGGNPGDRGEEGAARFMVSLRIHLVLYVLLVSAVTGAAVGVHGLFRQDEAVEFELRRTATVSAELLAAMMSEPLTRGARKETQTLVREWVARGDFARITVLDPLGNPLAHWVHGQPDPVEFVGPPAPAPDPAAPASEPPDVAPLAEGAPSSVEPVRTPSTVGLGPHSASQMMASARVVGPAGERLGTVCVEVKLNRGAVRAGTAAVRGAQAGGVALLLAGLVTALAAARLTTPLSRITEGVFALGRQNYGVKIPLSGPLELAGLAHMINNVAAQLKSMAALHDTTIERSNFINNVVESMVATLIVVDRDAKIRAVNQALVNLLGYEQSELVGRSSSLICVANGFHLSSTRLEQLLGHSALKDHEVTFITKDNRHIPISLSGSAIKDAQGRTTGYVCIGTDITQRKQAEAEKQKLNSQLVETSRQAGMAEVATGVLHNVGNVLNSINVSAAVVEETLRKSRVGMVRQIADVLGEHDKDLGVFLTNDAKGKAIPGYLTKLAQHLADEQGSLLNELRTLTSHVGHVKDIISVQQSVSRTAGVVEPVALRDLAEDALHMVAASMSKYKIMVTREYTEVPSVKTDKHRVLQILVNLMTNALDAMKEKVDTREGQLTVRIRRHRPDPRSIRIEVEDNGVGIPSENLTRIFTHGFTTKKKGHGFGLHSAALAAKELQGSLTVSSAGPDRGAVFTLVLPMEASETPPSASGGAAGDKGASGGTGSAGPVGAGAQPAGAGERHA